MAQPKNWAKGLILKQIETQYGSMLSAGVKRDEFVDWLNSLEVNEKGFCNLTFAPSKEAPKWGAWENEYKAKVTVNATSSNDDSDSLPF